MPSGAWEPPSDPLSDLEEGEVHIWLAADGIAGSVRAELEALLDSHEQEKYRSLRFEAHRARYLATHALLRTTLSRYYPVEPDRWRLAPSDFGPLYVSTPNLLDGVRISLSRTRGLVACLFSKALHCGVDVEKVRPMEMMDSVAYRMMQSVEHEVYEGLDGEARSEYFYQLWTLKEAYVKSLGVGLRIPLRSVFFDVSGEGIEMRQTSAPDRPVRDWQYWSDRPTRGHRVSAVLSWPFGGPHPVRVFRASPGLVDL